MSNWRDAIAKYDADVASGRITFDANGFAHFPYPDDHWLSDWVMAHRPYI